jgi:hypothetical protein
VAKRARATIEALLTADIAACQRNGDTAADADPGRLAALVLAVLRGIEALAGQGRRGDADRCSLDSPCRTPPPLSLSFASPG